MGTQAPHTVELSRAPRLSTLYLRAATALLPGVGRPPRARAAGGELPATELVLRDVRADGARLAAYREVTGFAGAHGLPPTYPHVLAFPLHMALMTSRAFPFRAIGLVHIENEITQARPLAVSEPLSFAVRAQGPQPHARGRTFTILTTARAGGEPVWEERSTMLSRGSSSADAAPSGAADAPGHEEPRSAVARERWTVARDTGRRYGAASGDRNPIHTHALGARAFGFAGPIAHGMWSKARCLAALARELPEAFSVHVRFRRPLPLGAGVCFECDRAGAALWFALRGADGASVHLEGRAAPAGTATGQDTGATGSVAAEPDGRARDGQRGGRGNEGAEARR